VEATTKLKALVLARDRFVELLGPLYSLMAREKSPAVVTQRLMRLQTKVIKHAKTKAPVGWTAPEHNSCHWLLASKAIRLLRGPHGLKTAACQLTAARHAHASASRGDDEAEEEAARGR
jgi:hypothetical protein